MNEIKECDHKFIKSPDIRGICSICGETVYVCPKCGLWIDNYDCMHGYRVCPPCSYCDTPGECVECVYDPD